MKWSFKIGRVFGIELRVHVTFFLIFAWVAFIWGVQLGQGWAGALYGAFFTIFLFGCVVIHELSHSRMAQHYGAEVASITLLPIGGVSMLQKMPEDPRKEFWVTLVGPLSNLVIGAILFPLLYVVPNPSGGALGALTDSNVLFSASVQGFLTYLFLVNILLAIFNLLPAFPMDGGRLFRSILAQRMSFVQATRIAVVTGQTFAFVMGIAGLFINPLLILVAVFIYLGAEAEGQGVETKDILSGLTVRQAATSEVKIISPDDPLGDIARLVLHEYQEDFPVMQHGQLAGMLTRSNLISGLHALGPDGLVRDVMETDFPVVKADSLFSEVYEKMNETRSKAVPVMDNGHLLGMVTLEHLSEVFMLLTATEKPLVRGQKPRQAA